MLLDLIKNAWNYDKYKTNSQAVIVSCFFNPQNNPYRLLAFQKWYNRIKHLNHRIVECLIGPNAKSQLPKSPYITQVRTNDLLWHKETLLNIAIKELPQKFQYVFWIDADVIFTNLDWMIDSVEAIRRGALIVQPFEYCIHMERNRIKPDFDVEEFRSLCGTADRHPRMWKSFCSNYHTGMSANNNYDIHGHVGFAWGARRELLEECPLYDRGLIGGADHIIAHAAAGHFNHSCIARGFADNFDEVQEWMREFNRAVLKYRNYTDPIGYAKGDLYHIWHGDISKRQYLKRVQDYTPIIKNIRERDKAGLYKNNGDKAYIGNYYRNREPVDYDFDDFDAGFVEDMGYTIYDAFRLFGAPYYGDEETTWDNEQPQEQLEQAVEFNPDAWQLEEAASRPQESSREESMPEPSGWPNGGLEVSEKPQEEPADISTSEAFDDGLSENFS